MKQAEKNDFMQIVLFKIIIIYLRAFLFILFYFILYFRHFQVRMCVRANR